MMAFDTAAARRRMVDSQLRPNRVLDPRIVAAMLEIPREAFVPPHLADVAYADEDLPVAPGRYLMEPMVFGRMLQEVGIGPSDRVLDVGCGSGYSSAVLSRLAARVVAVESSPELLAQARGNLIRLGAASVTLINGQAAAGAPEHAPFDIIIVGGSVEHIPDALQSQLGDGGRLVAVVQGRAIGKATIIERHGSAFGTRQVFDAATPALPGFERPKRFVF